MKGIKKLRIVSLLLICLFFSPLTLKIIKAENNLESEVSEIFSETPTLWVKIHRIKALDPIEEGWFESEADFLYTISVKEVGRVYAEIKSYRAEANNDDIIIDQVHSFNIIKSSYLHIIIQVWEMDGTRYDQNVDISKDTNYLVISYDMKTNSIIGDYVKDGNYLRTSGEWDGSEGSAIDENDAELWFSIWDNYDAPEANAGRDIFCYVGGKVNFDGSASSASSGSSIVKYEWDFESDGRIDAEGARTSFTFPKKGRYTVTLRVTDSIGETASDTLIVTVGNKPPIPSFTFSPEEPTIRDTIHFYDTSTDPDGTIVSWYWNFGEGHTSTIKDPTHDYADKGSYTITLRVTDDDGNSDSTTKILTFINLAPVADFTYSPSSPVAGKEIQFTDKSSDPEGKSLEYLWDFGDGTTSTKENPVHRYEEGGEYTVKLSVTDDEDDEDDIIKIVKILKTHDLTIEVKDILGLKIPNAEIELYADGESFASGKTDINGKLTFTEIAEGQYDIEVKVLGQTVSLTRSLSQPVTAQVQVTLSTNTLGITGGIGVIAALAGFYLMRRKKTTLPAKETNQEVESVSVVEDDSFKDRKKELEKERVAEMLKTFKEKYDEGEIDEETYLRLKNKYENKLKRIE